MNRKSTIFLTGATGLLGSHLLMTLLRDGHKVFALARGNRTKSAKDRVKELLAFWDSRLQYPSAQLEVIEGDIVCKDCGIFSKKTTDRIINETEIIYHCAAIAELNWPLAEIRKVNVGGTKNLLELGQRCKKNGSLRRINHVSTAYVVGNKSGIEFSEDMLELGQGFYNTYEQSKYEAELLVHRYKGKGLPVSIFRPSMVMGDSLTGKTTNFRLFYEPLHFFAAGIFDIFPSDHDSLINLININTVSKLLYNLGDQEIDTYHLTSLNDIVPRDLCQMASSFFKFKLPLFESRDKFNEGQWSPVQKKLAVVFIPYFNYKTKFLTRKLERVLLKTESKYTMPVISSKSLNPIFNYCNKAGFIRVRR